MDDGPTDARSVRGPTPVGCTWAIQVAVAPATEIHPLGDTRSLMSARPSSNRKHDRESFFKYATAHVTQLVLSCRTLRWSSPLLFNDPFDIPRNVTFGFDEDDLHRAVVEEFARLLEAGTVPPFSAGMLIGPVLQMAARATTKDRQALAENLRTGLRDGSLKCEATFGGLQAFWEKVFSRLRILCLSEINDSMLMWAHYSDGHRGVVIELSCCDELDSAWLVARPVVYMETPPRLPSLGEWVRCFTGQGTLGFEEIFKEYEYAKGTDWSYEREWRVVNFAREGESDLFLDWHVHPPEIRAVYLGERISESDATAILDLLQGDLAHVSTYREIGGPTTRRLRFEQVR